MTSKHHLVSAIEASPLWLSSPRVLEELGDDSDYIQGLDVIWYYRRFRDSFFGNSVGACVADYRSNAATLLRSPNLAFDELWYRNRYPQVDQMVMDGKFSSGWEHYLSQGLVERLNPVFWFDDDWYQKRYPEVYAAVLSGSVSCGFEHFLLHGIYHDLSPSLHFNSAWYHRQFLSEQSCKGSAKIPVVHYLLTDPGRRPSPVPFFDAAWYANQYLKPLTQNSYPSCTPFEHYLLIGRRLGYSPSAFFNEMAYRDRYPEVAALLDSGQYLTGFEHYAAQGLIDGYTAISHLDSAGADYCAPAFLRAFGRSLTLNVAHNSVLAHLLNFRNDVVSTE